MQRGIETERYSVGLAVVDVEGCEPSVRTEGEYNPDSLTG